MSCALYDVQPLLVGEIFNFPKKITANALSPVLGRVCQIEFSQAYCVKQLPEKDSYIFQTWVDHEAFFLNGQLVL